MNQTTTTTHTIECPTCHKRFVPRSRVQRFCCSACNSSYRNTAQYQWTRQMALRRDAYTCVECGQVGGRLEVHHITPLCMGGTHRLANLETRCRACHRAIHKRQSWRFWITFTRVNYEGAQA
jgi:5-methylcytosine-specific restriction endonuclease McrA